MMTPETQQSWTPEPNSSGQATTQDRYGVGFTPGYRRGAGEAPSEGDQHNGAAYEVPSDKPRLPSLDLEAPAEPDFSDDGWFESPNASGTLADHPLLRGLLLELPPKGSTPPPGWLDRWFEATRSILELLYVK